MDGENTGSYLLQESKSSRDLIDHHNSAVEASREFIFRRQRAFDYMAGNHHSPEDKAIYRRKNKVPVVFNLLKTAERAVVGLFISNKYDVSFMPFEPDDQDTATLRQILYMHTEYSQDWKLLDVDIFRQGWGAGAAYQEFWVDVRPGKEPKFKTTNLNNFCVIWDTESRQVITRYDAQWVDRETWAEWSTLCRKFPKLCKEEDWNKLIDASKTVEKTDRAYRETGILDVDVRNRRVKVVERFYKVYGESHHIMDQDMNKLKVDAEAARAMAGQYTYSEDDDEQLYLAVVCPRWADRVGGNDSDSHGYLFNGPYHCQPKDPQTGHIIWPILEFAAEQLQGDPMGFAEPMIGPNRIVNAMMANIFHNARHQAGTSLIRKKRIFQGKDATDFDDNHTDADRIFKAEDDADLTTDVVAVPAGAVKQDTYQALNISKAFAEEVSSAPPALKGMMEDAGVSGKLNGQRIEQAITQLRGINQAWICFLRQRAKLAQYYWKKYWNKEKIVRITNWDQLKKGPDFWSGDVSSMQQQVAHPTPQIQGLFKQGGGNFVKVNGMQPQTDSFGNETGAIDTFNDITQDEYDVVIEDSYQSPTYAERSKQQLGELLSNPGVQGDSQLFSILSLEYARYSDFSQETKNFLKAWSSVVQQKAQAAANQGPPQAPQDPIKVSLALKGEDLHDPAVMSMLEYSNAVPAGSLQALQNAPAPQPTPQNMASQADLHAKRIKNLKDMQSIAQTEVDHTMPMPGPQGGPSRSSAGRPRPKPAMKPAGMATA